MNDDHPHVAHSDFNIAHHFEWGFRKEALLWSGDYSNGVNFHPIATEFHQWLLRQGSFSIFSEDSQNKPSSFTNPYTYHASVIAAILATTIGATYKFAMSTEPIASIDAEIERIRLYNEQILYTARLCEATIKQLL